MSEFCQQRTKGSPPFYRGSPCGKKAVRDGFCGIHHPDAVAKRKEANRNRSEESYQRYISQANFKFKRPVEYRDALRRIAVGESDAAAIAREVLAKWGEEER